METTKKFKLALIDMLELGEFDRIIKNAKGASRRAAEKDKKFIKCLSDAFGRDIDKYSFAYINYEIKSKDIYANALCYMSRYDRDGKTDD